MSGVLPRFPELCGADVVVPVPLHAKRLRERGFNQALILAEKTASIYNRPIEECLDRHRDTMPQWFLNRSQRLENLRDAFRARDGFKFSGRSFLLIDDVCTTGATLENCAEALLRAGAKNVYAFVLARD
jgi:ComF family protein